MQKLKFGGKNLQKPQHTWYEDNATGKIVRVEVGEEVDASKVKNAEDYVKRGQAALVGGSGKRAGGTAGD